MKSFLKRIVRKSSSANSLITISISKSALLHNLNEFRRLVPHVEVAPVLKSNAYGHGLVLIARALQNDPLPFLVIDSHFEARLLRNEGTKASLLIIGYSTTEIILGNNLTNTKFTITSLDALKELADESQQRGGGRKILIHLKFDTGMNRQGLAIAEMEEAFRIIKKSPNIALEGICSHLADADNTDNTFTNRQISLWNSLVDKARKNFPSLSYWHISNTAGHAHPQAKTNLTRLGIGLYGIRYGAIVEKIVNLKPALEMTTIISGIKKIRAGDSVGYNYTFKAERDMTIGTIPVGYYEGLNRKLSNLGSVKIVNSQAPIIGRVSMNITCIDVSKIVGVKRDDKVTVISNNPEDKNSIENMARISGDIAYEIAVHIPAHLKRVLVE